MSAKLKSGVQLGAQEDSSREILDRMPQQSSIDNLICILQNCRKKRDLAYAKHVYANVCKNGLETHRAVGNYIVPMFVECGSVLDAEHVFNSLVHRNVHSWTSIMVGYIDCGLTQHALNLYQKMQEDRVHPNSYTFTALLKACASLKDVETGREIHVHSAQKGFERDVFVGSSLVDMYAKCGSLSEAQEISDKLPVRNVVSWTALISGYAEYGPSEKALKCFEQMQLEGISPDAVTFVCALKACGSLGAIDKGREVHIEITQKGFERDIFIGNTLVDLYARCGSLAEAQEIFDSLVVQNVVSWTALIAGYAEHGPCQEALNSFKQMQLEGVLPNAVTFVPVLKACGNLGDIDKGRDMHFDISQKGFETDVFVGNTLVDMYVKCGSLAEAQEIFDKFPVHNVVSWNALIAGYAEHGPGLKGLQCFEQMQLEGFLPDAVTLICILKVCGIAGAIDKGRKVHSDIVKIGFERDLFAGSTLIDMYAKFGSLADAQGIFDKLPVRNDVSWNALVAGYAEHGPCEEALKCFEQMELEFIPPDALTFVSVLKACGSIGAIDKGREYHVHITKNKSEGDIFVGSSLVDMYAKCGSLADAWEVFDKLPVRNVVSWNALIAGFAEHGPGQEALKCFEEMQLEGVSPDAVTFVWALKACGSTGAIVTGRELHCDIAQKGFESDVLVGSTVVDMYAKCGSLSEAHETFHKLPVQNVVSWTALISGYAEHGAGQEALKCFEQMQLEGVSPNSATFVCALKACGSIGAIDKGREIHADIAEKGFEKDGFVGSALVDMYAKCASLSEAQEVFDRLPVQDVMSWSSMIKGYGLNHEGNMALQCFEDMQAQGVKPDDITFTCLLTACSRARLLSKGQEFFDMMTEEFGIVPTIIHYTCMIDLLAKSGHLYAAEKFLETMPCPPVWTALLSSCKIYGEAELGLRCFQHLVLMNPECAGPYVLMAKIYATAGRWDDAYRIEELRKCAGAKKKPASALIEVNNKMHEFVVGNTPSKEILAILNILSPRMKEEGHVPTVNLVF